MEDLLESRCFKAEIFTSYFQMACYLQEVQKDCAGRLFELFGTEDSIPDWAYEPTAANTSNKVIVMGQPTL